MDLPSKKREKLVLLSFVLFFKNIF